MTTSITIRPLPEQPNLSPYQQTQPKAPDIVNDDFFGSFADLLDVINPLQHIPGVSTAYQKFTGDTVSSPGARILGGTLFGGPVGLLAAILNSIFENEAGSDLSGTLFAAATQKYDQISKLS